MFTVNEPTLSCCGKSPGSCTCHGAAPLLCRHGQGPTCPTCRAESLARNAMPTPTPSLDELLGPAPVVNVAYTDEPPLTLPEIVWGEGGIPGRAVVGTEQPLTVNNDDDAPLIPPSL